MTQLEELNWLKSVLSAVSTNAKHEVTKDVIADAISDINCVIRDIMDESGE